jgi:hypothetical protein
MLNHTYCFFKKFLNVTTSTVINFSVGFVEGVIEANITTINTDIMPEQTVDLVKQKTKNILIVAAGGATTKTTSILGQVAPILLSATPNLLV